MRHNRRRSRFCTFGRARQDPHEVGEAVQVGDEVGAGDEALALERDGAPLRPAQDRTRELQGRARWRLAGHDELPRHVEVPFELHEVALHVGDHRLGDARPAVFEPVPRIRVRRQLGPDHEEFALDTQDQLGEASEPGRERSDPSLGTEVGAGHAQRRDGLVDRAVGLGARVVLADALAAEQEPGRAVVTARRGDGGIDRTAPVGQGGHVGVAGAESMEVARLTT